MSGGDAYAEWDAAYVLGSLSAAERQEFEEHLAQCPSCQRAVAELAGMPGLLAQVPAREALGTGADTSDEVAMQNPAPASLMPALPAEVRAARRRWAVPAAAAAAALVVGALGGYAVSSADGDTVRSPRSISTSGPVRLAFSPVGSSAMTAVVDLTPSGAGTRVQVECQYALSAPDGYDPQSAWAEYAVWVVDRRGRAVLGATWQARPNLVMRPSAESTLAPSEIAAVEIRRVDSGQTVMRAERA